MNYISGPMILAFCCGLLAIVLAIIEGWIKKERSIWIVIATSIIGIGIIIASIWGAIEQDKKDKHIVDSITGGDSFCYIYFGPTKSSTVITRHLISIGIYPLDSVDIDIADITKLAELNDYSKENLQETRTYMHYEILHPNMSLELKNLSIPNNNHEQDYNIFYVARNGQWIQETRLRLVKGRWQNATRILKGKAILFKHVSGDYPLKNNGEVDWEGNNS